MRWQTGFVALVLPSVATAVMSLLSSSPHEADPHLLPYLYSTDEAEQEGLLASLISEYEPVIRGIIRNRLRFRITGGGTSQASESEDTYGEVIVRLLKRLRECKANPNGEVIRNFRSYIAVTALNACHDYLRKKYPQRWSLENKLRYVLIRDARFALWQRDEGSWLCGFIRRNDERVDGPAGTKVSQLRENPRAFLPPAISNTDLRLIKPADLLSALFSWTSSPVELSDLVTIVSDIWCIKDSATDSYDGHDQLFESIADPHPRSDRILELRMSLQQLWKEIRELPARQRVALLLNLRDEHERNVLTLIPDTRTATFEDIAATLNISLEQLTGLWQKLPLDDAAIAELLEATPRQVIRLRKCARDRLTRRLKLTKKRDLFAMHKKSGQDGRS